MFLVSYAKQEARLWEKKSKAYPKERTIVLKIRRIMVSVEDAVIARISKDNTKFEILVDSKLALDFKMGNPISLENVLAARDIFKDAKKGERAPNKDLEKYFNTTYTLKVAEEIIKNGEIQITTEQRRNLVDEKKRQLADIISKQGINPKTKLPHPASRILNAMEQARVSVDPFKPASGQVESVLSEIAEIIPISFERLEVAVRIPMQYAGKASSLLRGMTPVKKEEWKSDAWIALIEIPTGMQSEIYDKLNSLTSGQAEIKVVKRKEV